MGHLSHLLPRPGVPAQPGHLGSHLGLQLIGVRLRLQWLRLQVPPRPWLAAAVVGLALNVDELGVVVVAVLGVGVGAGVFDLLLGDAALP